MPAADGSDFGDPTFPPAPLFGLHFCFLVTTKCECLKNYGMDLSRYLQVGPRRRTQTLGGKLWLSGFIVEEGW